MRTYFKPGVWNVVCDVCGFRFKSDQVKKRWDGLIVCHQDYEIDHPQKYIRIREDGIAVPFIREDQTNYETESCWPWSRSAYADLATADCSQADTTSGFTYLQLYNMKNGSSY